jgi:hypothetical protein
VFTYTYDSKAVSPYLDGIHHDVENSVMTNKNIQYCNWSEETQDLDIVWDVELLSGDKIILDTIVTNNSTVPSFVTSLESLIQGTDPPIYKEVTWINTNDGLRYIWDSSRNCWRTLYRISLIFAFDGDADNDYLKIMTVYGSSTAYLIPKNAIITAISCRASGGNASKEFKIQTSIDIFSFSLSSLEYENIDTNIELGSGDDLKVHCEGDGGGSVENPIVILELAWRY